MNIEIFKRNIKLQELGIDGLSDMEQKMFDFLDEHLSDLNKYTCDKYEDYLFFGKDKENITLILVGSTVYVDEDEIWSFFELKFNMEHSDIGELIRWWCYYKLAININRYAPFKTNKNWLSNLELIQQ